MSVDTTQSVLKRLLEQVGHAPDQKLMSPSKALKNALPKAADHAVDLPLILSEIEQNTKSREALLETLEMRRLYILIQSEDGRLGLVVPDPGCLSGLIEIQTTGKVTEAEPDDRMPTRTDAALVEPFIDAILSEFAVQLEGDDEFPRYAGFSYHKLVEDVRHLPLLLPEDEYGCYDVSMGMGRVAKPARILFAFPSPTSAMERKVDVGSAQKWTETLEEGVMSSRAKVNVILHRVSIPLDEIEKMTVGHDILIPRKAVNSLLIEGSDGEVVSRGGLGQTNGFRAVKIAGDQESESLARAQLADLETNNPLEALGSSVGPIPVTQTDAVMPLGTGLPADFADISPPPEEPALPPLGDFPEMNALPEMDGVSATNDLPPLGDGNPIGDLPDVDFPAMAPIDVE